MDSTENKEITPAGQNLPAQAEQRVKAIADAINFGDSSLTVTYGADTMQEISRFADDLLSRVQAKDSGQVGETLTDLMVRVKGIDVTEITGGKRGFMANIPVIGSLFHSAERTVAKFNTLSEQISVISDKLEQAMVGLLHDVNVLDQLYKHNESFHNELVTYIEAGKRKIEEARTEDLPKLQKAAEESGDPMDAQKVRDFAEQINRFERRVHDLQLSRTITVQTAPQIRLIQSNNQTLAEKIQTSILTTIPIWKSQMVLALSLQGQQNAAQLQKTVSDTTNDMLRKNADMLEQAAVSTAREVERSVVDIETLRDVHGKLISTIEETMRIAQEGREKRAAVEKELAGMETQLKDQLTSLAVRKTQESITAAAGSDAPQIPQETSGETADETGDPGNSAHKST
ncbi:MAG: TelA-like protein [Desulfovibrio sp.]